MRVQVVAEIGINHQGSIAVAVDLMRAAKAAGADVVKLQKRDLELAIPPKMADDMRSTPWGPMRYVNYKRSIEFGKCEFAMLAAASRDLGIPWTSSAFDPPSVRFLRAWQLPFLKLPSAAITDTDTLDEAGRSGVPVVLSTGGSTWAEIDAAVERLLSAGVRLTLMHTCSVYPHPPRMARLLVLDELRQRYGLPVGWSGHEAPGTLAVTLGAVARGACMVERHVTLSRLQWGSDQKASIEPAELQALVYEIRSLEDALTTGAERPVDAMELSKIQTMRRSSWSKP